MLMAPFEWVAGRERRLSWLDAILMVANIEIKIKNTN
jgi:hypothetical protein